MVRIREEIKKGGRRRAERKREIRRKRKGVRRKMQNKVGVEGVLRRG